MSSHADAAFVAAQLVSLLTLLLIVLVILLLPAQVLRRAGYSRWWALVLLVPIVNLVMVWVFALADWPALRGAPHAGDGG